ncbi:MAG: CBS domain-containing protein [Candidatus Helarchaeota archaeon]
MSLFYIPTPEELKKARKELKISQSELAKLANVSQSLIARIENNTVDPRISTLRKIINALSKFKEKQKIINEFAIKDVITIRDEDPVIKAANIMNEKGISQLVVLDKNNNIIGSIREKSITRKLLEIGNSILKNRIVDHMDSPFPEISSETPLNEIKSLLLNNDAIVLTERGNLVGIVTKADIIRYYQNIL